MGDNKYPPGYIPLTIHELSSHGGKSGNRSRGGSSDPHAALEVRDDSFSVVNGGSKGRHANGNGGNGHRRFHQNGNGGGGNGGQRGGRRNNNNRRRRGGGRGLMDGERPAHESFGDDDFDDGGEE